MESSGPGLRLVFLIRSLERGGAERQLLLTARGLANRHRVSILTFYPVNDTYEEAAGLAGHIVALGKRGRWDLFGFGWRVFKALRSERPDVVYSFLATGSLWSLLAMVATPSARIVWGIRVSDMPYAKYDLFTRFTVLAEKWLSGFAHMIIVNSVSGARLLEHRRYRAGDVRVIHNGIDAVQFAPDAEARSRWRGRFGIGEHERVIGMVSRLDPVKGNETFIEAAAEALANGLDARFVLRVAGAGAPLVALKARAEACGLGRALVWVEGAVPVHELYNVFDVFASASLGEGFSNVICEAMACGVPCVVTDVGDSAHIVGDTGEVVPPGSSFALAEGWRRMIDRLDEEGSELSGQVRERIRQLFSLERMVNQTERLLLEVAARPTRR